ncbi:Hypothetical protein NG00_01980 [Corynebacterium camporealensis]|uniref:Uncharacterized protein n=1 Tax=Corynebacterium camporealensis TaxID=161896 RepID=A0A0F6TC76_9CORY|nr:hypothetical protein [Corynebacterium camporealensis]AKE40146.1 hypothetical protein UL81_11070 [Corynebacterium camporealensis]AVH89218.1 Hypothetical protein NG00_01980 [Corynebacterium camporealensis]
MYFERLEDGDISKAAARREIGELLGVKESTLRNWIRKQEKQEQAPQPGSLSYEQIQAAYEEQSKEVAKLRRANEILKSAANAANACACSRRAFTALISSRPLENCWRTVASRSSAPVMLRTSLS